MEHKNNKIQKHIQFAKKQINVRQAINFFLNCSNEHIYATGFGSNFYTSIIRKKVHKISIKIQKHILIVLFQINPFTN